MASIPQADACAGGRKSLYLLLLVTQPPNYMRTCTINSCLFLLLVCNLSCKKTKEYVSDGTLLSKVVYTEKYNGITSTSTLQYSYNSNNQLVSIASDNAVINSFEYNASRQLITAKNFTSPQGTLDIATFVHDAQGRIVQKIDSPIQANLEADNHHYAYDLNNNIIADSTPNLVTPETIGAFDIYEYNVKGNVVKISSYDYSTGSPVLLGTTGYTYSDKPNPYYYNREALYFSTRSFAYLSKNLESERSDTKYSYYTNGLLRETASPLTKMGSPVVGTSISDYIYK
jgi:hypothetical protein